MQPNFPRSLTLLATLLFLLTSPLRAYATDTDVIAAWVQYTVDGVEARAVVQDRCPAIRIDGRSVGMVERAAPTEEHLNTVCTAKLPRGVRSVRLNGEHLPVPVEQPKRIVVMGDTGCRLSKKHGLYQSCDNDSLWPFAQVARSVEAAAPDLILYTGDYIYRESPCLDGDVGCKESPYIIYDPKDGEDVPARSHTWEADWLLPGQPVHRAAPLLLIRGNHEVCKRAGKGWFRYLDARPYSGDGDCEDATDPWVVTFRSMQIAVMDVTSTKDEHGNSRAPQFAAQLRQLDSELYKPAWIASHRPFFAFGADDEPNKDGKPVRKIHTSELHDVVREAGVPRATRLFVGAHIHLAGVLNFDQGRPPQLIVANGGTQLVPSVPVPPEIDGVAIQLHKVIYQYGFVTMSSKHRNRWSMSFNDVEGRGLERCLLSGKRVRCADRRSGHH